MMSVITLYKVACAELKFLAWGGRIVLHTFLTFGMVKELKTAVLPRGENGHLSLHAARHCNA